MKNNNKLKIIIGIISVLFIASVLIYISSLQSFSQNPYDNAISYWKFDNTINDELGVNNLTFGEGEIGYMEGILGNASRHEFEIEDIDLVGLETMDFWYYVFSDEQEQNDVYISIYYTGYDLNGDCGEGGCGEEGYNFESYIFIELLDEGEGDWSYKITILGYDLELSEYNTCYIESIENENIPLENVVIDGWNHFVLVIDGTNAIFVNNNVGQYGMLCEAEFNNEVDEQLLEMEGNIDNMLLTKTPYTIGDIAESYNGGLGTIFTPTAIEEPTVTMSESTSGIASYTLSVVREEKELSWWMKIWDWIRGLFN